MLFFPLILILGILCLLTGGNIELTVLAIGFGSFMTFLEYREYLPKNLGPKVRR